MTPLEMEEAIKNLNARTRAIEQFLPTLATRDDLRLTTEALQYEIETGFQDAKRQFDEAKAHAERLNDVTREQIRIVAQQTGILAQQIRIVAQQTGTVAQQMATKGDLERLQQALSKQLAGRGAPTRKTK